MMNKILKKIRNLLMLVVSIFILTGCDVINSQLPISSIEIDGTTLEDSYEIDNFDLSSIKIKVSFSDGTFKVLPLTKEMLSSEHLSLLNTVGEHEITINYKDKTTQVIINLIPTEPLYSINFHVNGGSDIPPIIQKYQTIVIMPLEPSKKGYIFDGWYLDEELTIEYIFSTMPAENITLYAKWNVEQYTITFDTDGGDIIAPITKNYGEVIEIPDNPRKEGYTFVGWDQEIPATMPTANITITAEWSINQYTIHFESNGGSPIDSITQDYDTEIIVPDNPRKEGYTFVGWDQEIPATMPSADKVIKAQWSINSYTITFDTDGGNIIVPITKNYGEVIEVPDNPRKEGYTFVGWDQEIPTTMPSADKVIKAQWSINSYTITFDTDGGDIIAPITKNYGETVIAPSNPTKEENKFEGWFIDKELTNSYIFSTMPAENIILYAKWNTNKYTITFESNGGSNVSPITQIYNGEIQEPVAPTRDGHIFEGWYYDAELEDYFTFFDYMPACDFTLYAKWTAIFGTITFESNGGSSVPPITQIYTTLVTAPVNPTRKGYDFKGWYCDESLTNIYTFSNMPNYKITLYAKWSAKKNTVIFESNGGTLIPTQNDILTGTVIELPTPNRDGYQFEGWYLDENGMGEFIWSKLYVDDSITLYAKWKSLFCKVTFLDENGEDILFTKNLEIGSSYQDVVAPIKEGYVFSGWYNMNDRVIKDMSVIARYNRETAISKDLLAYRFETLYKVNGYPFLFDDIERIAIVYDGVGDFFLQEKVEFPKYIDGYRVATFAFVGYLEKYSGFSIEFEFIRSYDNIQEIIFPDGIYISRGFRFLNSVKKITFLDGPETTVLIDGLQILYGLKTIEFYQIPHNYWGDDQMSAINALPLLYHAFDIDTIILHCRLGEPEKGYDFKTYHYVGDKKDSIRFYVRSEDLEYYHNLTYWDEVYDRIFPIDVLDGNYIKKLITVDGVAGWEILRYNGKSNIAYVPAFIDGLPVLRIGKMAFSSQIIMSTGSKEGQWSRTRHVSVVIMESTTPPEIDPLAFLFEPDDRPPHIIVPNEAYDTYITTVGWEDYLSKNYHGVSSKWIYSDNQIIDNYLVESITIDEKSGWNLLCYLGETDSLTIPSQLEGIDVIALGDVLLMNRIPHITEITIPANIMKVGRRTFAGNEKLKNVTFEPNSQLRYIDPGCFNVTDLKFVAMTTRDVEPYNVSFNPYRVHTTVVPEELVSELGVLPPHVGRINASGWIYTIDYENEINGAIIQGCTNTEETLIIPETLGGYPVTAIGKNAFEYDLSIKSIVFPDIPITIGEKAFFLCRNLSEVKLGNAPSTINENAFYYCRQLTNVDFGGVVYIENNAFLETNLGEIELPNTISYIGKGFYARKLLLNGHIASVNSSYPTPLYGYEIIVLDGPISKIKSSRITYYYGNEVNEEVTFPFTSLTVSYATNPDVYTANSDYLGTFAVPDVIYDEIRAKYPYAKLYRTEQIIDGFLVEMTVVDGVEGYKIIEYLKTDSHIVIPAYLNGIPVVDFDFVVRSEIPEVWYTVEAESMFFKSIDGIIYSKDGTRLIRAPRDYPYRSLSIPYGVIEICSGACVMKEVYEIIMPSSVTTISDGAFIGLKGYFTLSDNITKIDDYAFRSCNFYKFNWPKNLQYIGKHAFYGAIWFNEVKDVLILPSNLKEIDNYAFGDQHLKQVVLPDGLEKIGSQAFNCDTIVIPETVYFLGFKAITANEVFFKSLVPPNGDDNNIRTIIANNESIFSIKVPAEAIDLYKSSQYFEVDSIYFVPSQVDNGILVFISSEPGMLEYRIVNDGEVLNIDEPKRSGYLFNGWLLYVGGDEEQWIPYDLSTPVTTSIRLRADWVEDDSQLDNLIIGVNNLGYYPSLYYSKSYLFNAGNSKNYKMHFILGKDYPVEGASIYFRRTNMPLIIEVYNRHGDLVYENKNRWSADNQNLVVNKYMDLVVPEENNEYIVVIKGICGTGYTCTISESN